MTYCPWTSDEDSRLIELAKTMTFGQIGKRLSRTTNACVGRHNRLVALGEAQAKGERSIKLRVRDLLEQDIAIDAIAARLGTSRKAVNARIGDLRRDLGWQAS